jgi:hypothetical protein
MGKKKENDNIIREGDLFKIINPQIFKRCGYPLNIQMVKDAFTAEQDDAVRQLLKTFGIFGSKDIFQSNVFQANEKLFEKVKDVLARRILSDKGFGGRERKIYTEEQLELKDKTFRCIFKRVVNTGMYQPCHQDYFDQYDCDPAHLSNQKTHVILAFWKVGDMKEMEIERCHVEKIQQSQVVEEDAYIISR